jgi:hypothetical protein
MRAFREQRQSNQAGTDYLTRLQRRADALIARGNALKSFGAAAAPLYQSLDEAQKHHFAALSRAMGPHHYHRFAAGTEERASSDRNSPQSREMPPRAMLQEPSGRRLARGLFLFHAGESYNTGAFRLHGTNPRVGRLRYSKIQHHSD